MTLRFPGEARPSTTPLQWGAWTGDASVLRFPGEATPSSTSLRWDAWTRPTSAPEAAPVPPRPAALPRPTPVVQAAPPRPPAPAASTATQAPLGTPDGHLAAAMLANHQAVAHAHEAFLEAQEAHLALTEAVHRRLAALAGVLAG